ncbi:MAG: hypothetical protein GW778_07065 [Alphaproteobacteria bacterium]|nr:hypothetical protein [Alphaproteobacteria bacterium]
MLLEYAERRIAEALKLAKGNQARARQQVIAWALSDDKLLKALTKSHLSGIVAYNIERVASGRAAAARKNQKPIQNPAAATAKPKKEPDFGVELLRAVASSSSEVFGLENGSAGIGRPKQVSQNHINAIRAIASKSKKS